MENQIYCGIELKASSAILVVLKAPCVRMVVIDLFNKYSRGRRIREEINYGKI